MTSRKSKKLKLSVLQERKAKTINYKISPKMVDFKVKPKSPQPSIEGDRFR